MLNKRLDPYIGDIRQYCSKLTASPWDAEDLLQETLLKAYLALERQPERPINKAYLYRIASNTWIDQCRKKRLQTEPFDEQIKVGHPSGHSPFQVREAFEQLAHSLSAKQMVFILMVDIFEFTSRETAALLSATEGSVKEGLKRARRKLKELASRGDEKSDGTPVHSAHSDKLPSAAIEAFLRAFRAGNPQAIFDEYHALRANSITPVRMNRAEEGYYCYFRDPDGHLLCIRSW